MYSGPTYFATASAGCLSEVINAVTVCLLRSRGHRILLFNALCFPTRSGVVSLASASGHKPPVSYGRSNCATRNLHMCSNFDTIQ
jgi:hypothetical protein